MGHGVLLVGSFWCWLLFIFFLWFLFLSTFLWFFLFDSVSWVSLVLCLCVARPLYYMFFYVYIAFFKKTQALWKSSNISEETSTWHTNFHTSISLHRFKRWELIWERVNKLKFVILSVEIANIVFWASICYPFYWELIWYFSQTFVYLVI